MNPSAIPVIYYHSVKHRKIGTWFNPQDTMLLKDFERHVKYYEKLKFKTFFFDDLYLHLNGTIKLPFNSILLTFDDGYLDNFVFVFPLLKKYKLKATIWVAPDFVDSNDHRVRPTLEDYWNNKISLDELNGYDGFLTWEEMRIMEKSGCVDIQSHTLTHTKYPVSDEIIDFVSPSTKIDWLYWNLHRDDKPNYLTTPKYKIPTGYPVYKNQKANIAVKYEEDGNLTREILSYVSTRGKDDFFNDPEWKQKLHSLSKAIKKHNNISYKKETDEEYKNRIRMELVESKIYLERQLNKKVNHVCWPYGKWNLTTENIAMESGYLTTTAKGQKNVFRKDYSNRVERMALDNPKFQNQLFYPYATTKIFSYKNIL